jgi:hypothetical protein
MEIAASLCLVQCPPKHLPDTDSGIDNLLNMRDGELMASRFATEWPSSPAECPASAPASPAAGDRGRASACGTMMPPHCQADAPHHATVDVTDAEAVNAPP